MSPSVRYGLFILALAVSGFLFFASHAQATISSKVRNIEMNLEQIEMGPIPLEASR